MFWWETWRKNFLSKYFYVKILILVKVLIFVKILIIVKILIFVKISFFVKMLFKKILLFCQITFFSSFWNFIWILENILKIFFRSITNFHLKISQQRKNLTKNILMKKCYPCKWLPVFIYFRPFLNRGLLTHFWSHHLFAQKKTVRLVDIPIMSTTRRNRQ